MDELLEPTLQTVRTMKEQKATEPDTELAKVNTLTQSRL
jgi:hypothetical protein